MIQVLSRVLPGSVICKKVVSSDYGAQRFDFCSTSESLQGSARLLPFGFEVRAHTHLPQLRETSGTSEAWIVFEGCLEAMVYDVDDSLIDTLRVISGEAVFFFRGGHSLKTLAENTKFLEVKNGPYFGAKEDKRFL